jgi:hypothetical protein
MVYRRRIEKFIRRLRATQRLKEMVKKRHRVRIR